MKRGVVTLGLGEVRGLWGCLVGDGKNDALTQRLASIDETEENQAELQLSEEEVELLLDALPAPGEDEILSGVRGKLQNFLNRLRSE